MPSAESSHADDPDAKLMQRLQQGDEQAFDEIVRHWQQPLINYLCRSLRSYQHAEDVAQMVFIRLYKAAPNYTPSARFSTYLFQIARHLLINAYRQEQRKPLDTVDPGELQAITDDSSDRRVREIEEVFAQALHKLPENQRTAILLLKQQELSYLEIAAIMDCTEGAVKTWIFRARQFLKQELKDLV